MQKPKISWTKSLDMAALYAEASQKEDALIAEGRYANPYTYRWVYWLREQLGPQFLEWCKRSNSAELHALWMYAESTGQSPTTGVYHCLWGRGSDIQFTRHCLDCMTICVQTPAGKLEYCPYYKAWKAAGKDSGVTDQECGDRFMQDPYNLSFGKDAWGKDFLQAVEDYCRDKKPGRLLLANKSHEIVRGDAGGRVIFPNYQAALDLLFPDGYGPEDSLIRRIQERRDEILEHIRSCPGAANWLKNG